MRVICRRYLDASGNPRESSGSLTIGRSYVVLEVIFTRGEVSFRVESEGSEKGTYGIHLARGFDVFSGLIPSAWTFAQHDGSATLAPPEWQRPGFWEDFYDGDPAAMEEFERRKREIYASEPPGAA